MGISPEIKAFIMFPSGFIMGSRQKLKFPAPPLNQSIELVADRDGIFTTSIAWLIQ